MAAGYASAFFFLSLPLCTIPLDIAYAVWPGTALGIGLRFDGFGLVSMAANRRRSRVNFTE